MAELGWASLGIVPTMDKGFGSSLGRQIDPTLAQTGRDSGKRFGGILGKAAVAGAAGIIGAGFAAFKLGKEAVTQASDLNESLNAVNLTYNKQSKAVKKLGREAADTLGLSNAEFNGLAVQFSSFSKTVAGSGGKKVVKTLDDLTTRASDFASVMNLEVSDAAGLFQSGLAGETEPLKKFGIDLSAAAVGAHAVATGMVESAAEMTEAEKVQARYSLLMKSTKSTQGDFANTSDELANSQRILSAEWKNAQAQLGTALLPIMKDATGFVLDKGIPAFEDFSDWFIDTGIPAIEGFVEKTRPLAEELLPAAADALGIVRDAGKDALPYIEGIVDAFNDMPDWAKKAIVGGGATALLGAKLLPDRKGGGLGGSGLLGSLKPVPVFVTNMGGGLGGAGAGGGKGGKPKGKFPFVAGASPFLLPLALGGDAAPGQAGDRNAAEKAYARLLEVAGGDKQSGEVLFDNLAGATRDEIVKYRKMIRDEFGVGFNEIRKLKFESGRSPLPEGIGATALRKREAALDPLRKQALGDTFSVSPKGIGKAEKDFLRLLGYRNDLHDKDITPSVRLLGVPQAKRDLGEVEKAALDAAAAVATAVSGALGNLGIGDGAVPTTVYNGPVTYTDDEQGRRAARLRNQRAGSDGIRR